MFDIGRLKYQGKTPMDVSWKIWLWRRGLYEFPPSAFHNERLNVDKRTGLIITIPLAVVMVATAYSIIHFSSPADEIRLIEARCSNEADGNDPALATVRKQTDGDGNVSLTLEHYTTFTDQGETQHDPNSANCRMIDRKAYEELKKP